MAAGTAAERGLAVLALEQMPRPGLKLLASGGGRCNVTHAAAADEIMAAFGRQGRFMAPALASLGPDALRGWLRDRGVETVVEPDGCVFPQTQSASSVLRALAARLAGRGAEVRASARADRLLTEGGVVRGVVSSGAEIRAPAVIVASGGRSYAALGGTGGGYALAQQAGHTVRPLLPALVPLVTGDAWVAGLSGNTLPDVELRVADKAYARERSRGPLLFTHRGISGPAVLNLSGCVAGVLQREPSATLRINWVAGEDSRTWAERLDAWRAAAGARRVVRLLQEFMAYGIAAQLCALSGIGEDHPAGRLSRAQAEGLVKNLTALELRIAATEGFEKAMVTRGGVALKEVDPDTLQSRLVRGLFFCGEVLDLDGPCGGYNLQWAFASGMLAGQSCQPERTSQAGGMQRPGKPE